MKLDKQMDALPLFYESSEMIKESIGVEHPVRGRSNSLPRVIFCLF